MLKRIAILVRERFPLGPSIVAAALMACSADVIGARLGGRDGVIDIVSATMSLVVLLLLFLVRAVDEVRDVAADTVAHPDRPLPRGAVEIADVVVAAVVAVVVAVAVVGVVVGGSSAVVVLCACGVTVVVQLDGGFGWVARRPVLSLLLHQLLVPLWVLLVIVVRAIADEVAVSVDLLTGSWPAVCVALGLSLLFELGRKLHHHDDENVDDDSWSQTFGERPAALIVAGLAALVMVPVMLLTTTLSLPVWSLLVPGVAVVWVIGSALFFAIAPRRGGGTAIAVSTALASLWVYLPLIAGAV